MKKIIFFLIALLMIIFSSCGKKVYVDTQMTQISQNLNNSNGKIVILPFSNYAGFKNFNNWLKLNLLIHNAISDSFLENNFNSVPFTNILSFLKKGKMIKINTQQSNISPGLVEELNNPMWSKEMKNEILKIAYSNKELKRDESQPFFTISKNKLIMINNNFNAKYIVWGEIYDFSIKKENTFNPLKIGFINSPVKIFSQTLFGQGESSGWSTAQHVFSGALLGGIFGSLTNEPFNDSTSTTGSSHLFGFGGTKHHNGPTDYQWGNAAFWGVTTGFATYIGEHGGNLQKVTIGLKIYIYNGNMLNPIWTNRIKIHVSPESMYACIDLEELIEYAINKSVNSLLNNFWSYKKNLTLNSAKN